MRLLALDTTSKSASVALWCDGCRLALVAPPSAEQHSVLVFRAVQQALAEAGLRLADIDVYAAASGPGAFTALRVGLTAVKGWAETCGKPVVPVSALEAVCESVRAEGLLVPLLNAYRGQVFGGIYEKKDGELELRRPERVLTLAEFLAALARDGLQAEHCTLVGPEVELWAAQISDSLFRRSRCEAISPALADAVARRAERKFRRGEFVDALHLEANYVRRSDAELLWKEK
ncbi:MAG: tRNA (adenosine(37)-N6)-threonylcarbamoyltransferase complex dimerization subunit type 1 TsaB [Acidobacteria bacterium]|nr:tRNA (adenosine(37)-N6)-threonylcarbamoyltransferase complex dimerization subunit type 1 TsaB [Acidobacteriota bacterium]